MIGNMIVVAMLIFGLIIILKHIFGSTYETPRPTKPSKDKAEGSEEITDKLFVEDHKDMIFGILSTEEENIELLNLYAQESPTSIQRIVEISKDWKELNVRLRLSYFAWKKLLEVPKEKRNKVMEIMIANMENKIAETPQPPTPPKSKTKAEEFARFKENDGDVTAEILMRENKAELKRIALFQQECKIVIQEIYATAESEDELSMRLYTAYNVWKQDLERRIERVAEIMTNFKEE